MKNVQKISAVLAVGFSLLFVSSVSATTYTFADTWINWPGYTETTPESLRYTDESGTPQVDHIDVTVIDGLLTTIDVVLHDDPNRQAFDSLFINTNWNESSGNAWDNWTYLVHDGGSANTENTDGHVPAKDGLYAVDDDFVYTTVINENRISNPNGIDRSDLSMVDPSVEGVQSGYHITYDFGSGLTVTDGFFVAYAPFCANDVMGGGAPVPEPASMLLFGFGLIGVGGSWFRRKKSGGLK